MFFLMFGTAIAAFQIHRLMSDEVSKIVTGLIAQLCLVLSVAHAPWFIQLLAIVAIVTLFPRIQTRFLE